MNHYVNWYMGNGLLLNVIAPLDYGPNPSVPVVMDSASTVTAHLFDKDVKSTTTKSETAATSAVYLESVVGFSVGDEITIEETDATFLRRTIANIGDGGDPKRIGISVSLPTGCAKGARVWKTYGNAVVTGIAYGTPLVTTTDWGYVFEFVPNYDSNLIRNQRLEAMVVLKKSSTSASYTRTWEVIVAEPYGTP